MASGARRILRGAHVEEEEEKEKEEEEEKGEGGCDGDNHVNPPYCVSSRW